MKGSKWEKFTCPVLRQVEETNSSLMVAEAEDGSDPVSGWVERGRKGHLSAESDWPPYSI